ncbi:hypothetical protein EGU05_14980 [Acinetobacter baumannii]|nr:hypothetical protein EGU05_14980 [Acinetobacter baumannii]
MFILRFAKALVALSCSGGFFLYLYKTKITYLPKALLRHFSRELESIPGRVKLEVRHKPPN